jgi:chromosome segregation ATPase
MTHHERNTMNDTHRALRGLETQLRRIADALQPIDDDAPDDATPAELRLRRELAAIRRALDPDDEKYIDETVHEQFRLQDRIDAQQRRIQAAEARRDELRTVLTDVLSHFTYQGHPGEPCLSSGWIPVATVEAWRTALQSTGETQQ